jgi:hypothetical protein
MDKRTRTALAALASTFGAGHFRWTPKSSGAILRGFPAAGNASAALRLTSRNWQKLVEAGAVVELAPQVFCIA